MKTLRNKEHNPMAPLSDFSKRHKILNDPLYGFISIQSELIFRLMEHPYFQRLRRISQLGLTSLVFPGAYHVRFHHVLGATYLMRRAIDILRSKGVGITGQEEESACIAILLHDIGHGPFSHALEHTVVRNVNHEALSLLFMEHLNSEFDGALTQAISIFKNEYPKRYLHELISGQLDMDRLDYLRRDSFYTGVTEGSINSERLLTMLNVADDRLVVDAKGIYSVEKFIVARSLMYWQVYLHKTVLSAEYMLVNVLRRAKELAASGVEIFANTALRTFLYRDPSFEDFKSDPELLETFARLDDSDIMSAIKEWCLHEDPVLSELSRRIVNRELFKVKMQVQPFSGEQIDEIQQKLKTKYPQLNDNERSYFLIRESTSNETYRGGDGQIRLLYKDGSVRDIAGSDEQLNIGALQKTVTRYILCFPKGI